MTRPGLLIFDEAEALYAHATGHVVRLAQEAVAQRGRFLMALSGGSAPLPLYEALAESPQREAVPWAACIFLWGDERLVPPGHPESNFGAARATLLDRVPVPAGNVLRIRGELDAVAAVAAYEEQLAALAPAGNPLPRIDLALMGMGADGHTASLFPGSVEPAGATVLAVEADYEERPAQRVTLTSAVFNRARHVIFLVRGAEKAEALAATLDEEQNPARWPAQRIRPVNGEVYWYVDRPAVGLLKES